MLDDIASAVDVSCPAVIDENGSACSAVKVSCPADIDIDNDDSACVTLAVSTELEKNDSASVKAENVSYLADIDENDCACSAVMDSCPAECVFLANNYDSNNAGLVRLLCSVHVSCPATDNDDSANVLCSFGRVSFPLQTENCLLTESGLLDRDLLHIQRLVSMVTEYDTTNAEIVHLFCNAEVVGEDNSSVQSSDEWDCLAKDYDDSICLLCLEDGCTMITYVRYAQYCRDLSTCLDHTSADISEADLVALYVEGKGYEIEIEEQWHVCLVIEKLIKDGLILAVRQAVFLKTEL
jgi:hypothetical protein